ncbi:MAG TPA: hypothetical protein VEH82_04405 [Acidimicrobiales bacterium]|nr:hypothetical protein [Acidimicrobiales bacterium]
MGVVAVWVEDVVVAEDDLLELELLLPHAAAKSASDAVNKRGILLTTASFGARAYADGS